MKTTALKALVEGISEAGTGTATSAVHLVLQGKGGVGKSFVASILGQYFRERSKNVESFHPARVSIVIISSVA